MRPAGLSRLAGAVLILAGLGGCGETEEPMAQHLTGGDPEAGRRVIAGIACGVCHVIPGVRGADGTVGPSLAGFAGRAYIAGVVPNRPALLVQWVQNAPDLAPNTAMPSLPITEPEARDIAASLYTLH